MTETPNPEMLSKQGKAAYQRADYLDAAKAFEAAAQAYRSLEKELEAAEEANNASVAFLLAEEKADALRVVEGTPAIFAAAGDTRRQGISLGNYAAALEAVGRVEEALEIYQQSAEVLDQAGEDQLRSKSLQSLSALQIRSGRQMQALASMQAGLEGLKKPSLQQRLLKKLLDVPAKMIKS